MAAECGVAAVVIVGVQPGREFVAAFCVVPVEAGIGPFVGQGAMKSLHFSVGLWSVGPGAAVFDATKGVGEDVGAVLQGRMWT